MKLTRDDLLGWVKASATTVADYYGHFPVPHLTLKMRSTSGAGIRHGVTYPKDGGLIFISVGRDADIAATKEDWVLVHEMIHLAFPSMQDEQHWIEEGISTYVEPVARVRAGGMPLDEMWRTFVRDMPKGEPEQTITVWTTRIPGAHLLGRSDLLPAGRCSHSRTHKKS